MARRDCGPAGWGGTNLFDATLPEAVSAHDGGKTIAQATRSARGFYLLVMGAVSGYVAYWWG